MFRKMGPICSLVIIPAVVLLIPLAAQSDQADPEDVARMIFGHKKIEGVVTGVGSGLYTVRASTGTTLTLSEAEAVRSGHRAPKVGDELTLWVNEGNMVIDAHPKGHPGQAHRFLAGKLASIDRVNNKLTLSMSGVEKTFPLKHESRTFRDIADGARVAIEVNETGEVVDIHADKE